jgi:hypothetical protein
MIQDLSSGGDTTVGAQPLGDREHHLSVRHGRQERRVQPLRPDPESPGVATRAEVPALAGEGQQVLVRTDVAADAREVVFEDTAREELVGHLGHDGRPRAVLAGEAVVVDRSQPMQMIRHQRGQLWRLALDHRRVANEDLGHAIVTVGDVAVERHGHECHNLRHRVPFEGWRLPATTHAW